MNATADQIGRDPLVRVVLADDHPVVRAGIIGMLAAEADIEVVGEAGTGHEAVRSPRSRVPTSC